MGLGHMDRADFIEIIGALGARVQVEAQNTARASSAATGMGRGRGLRPKASALRVIAGVGGLHPLVGEEGVEVLLRSPVRPYQVGHAPVCFDDLVLRPTAALRTRSRSGE